MEPNKVNAYMGHGTVLSYREGEEWVKVAHLVNTTPPAVTTTEIESTDHDSAGFKQFISGIKDGGEIPFTINVADMDNVQKLFALADSGEVARWKIDVPTSPMLSVEVDAFLKSFALSALDSGTAITATGALRCSGKPVYEFVDGE